MRPKPISSDVTRHVANAAELPSPALAGSAECTAMCTPETLLEHNTYTYTHFSRFVTDTSQVWNFLPYNIIRS